eukprot:TRINITY_DN4923_c0_g1_i1.p3 TRINITY_DN4923_c0_g1~~TRINITY_DN4923_c0_g1_i1.p3  ORF type:complete len:194 (-),score=51.78 TRINITY_DN4923_c0_g1_i1:303-884(-)
MLAQTSTRPKTCLLSRARTATPVVRRAMRVCCSQESKRVPFGVTELLACVATVTLAAQPAIAGVSITQPSLKKTGFFDDKPAEVQQPKKKEFKKKGSSDSSASFSAPSFSAPSFEGPSLDARTVALPGAIGGIVASYYLLTAIDPKFGDVLRAGSVKDSTIDGAGYEPQLKTGSPGKSGTKAIGKKAKKGGFF